MTDPGSVATILRTCPWVISARDCLVRSMGNGQTRPRASSSLSKSMFGYCKYNCVTDKVYQTKIYAYLASLNITSTGGILTPNSFELSVFVTLSAVILH